MNEGIDHLFVRALGHKLFTETKIRGTNLRISEKDDAARRSNPNGR